MKNRQKVISFQGVATFFQECLSGRLGHDENSGIDALMRRTLILIGLENMTVSFKRKCHDARVDNHRENTPNWVMQIGKTVAGMRRRYPTTNVEDPNACYQQVISPDLHHQTRDFLFVLCLYVLYKPNHQPFITNSRHIALITRLAVNNSPGSVEFAPYCKLTKQLTMQTWILAYFHRKKSNYTNNLWHGTIKLFWGVFIM